MDFYSEYRSKLRTPEQAVQCVKSGDWIDYTSQLGFPILLDRALSRRRDELFDVKIRGNLIFNRLEDYMTVSGYLSAPVITLDTLYETTKWKIFAVMLTNADPEDNNGYVFDYLYSSFSSDSSFIYKMNQIRARSMIHTGVDVEPGDKTLMLYTCYRTRFNSGRLVIVARQLREGESEEINTSLVYYDSSAIFPAAYYTGSPTTTAEPASETTTALPEDQTADDTGLTDATLPTADTPSESDAPADNVQPDAPEEPGGEPVGEEETDAPAPAEEPADPGE